MYSKNTVCIKEHHYIIPLKWPSWNLRTIDIFKLLNVLGKMERNEECSTRRRFIAGANSFTRLYADEVNANEISNRQNVVYVHCARIECDSSCE